MELTALHHVIAAKDGGSNPLGMLIPLILIVVVFYFLLIRPQRRRQQQQTQMQRQLRPGQRVMTTAGLLATVVAIEDDAIVLEIAPGVESRFVKQAIGQVLDENTVDSDEEEAEDQVEEEPDTAPKDTADTKGAEEAPAETEEAEAGNKKDKKNEKRKKGTKAAAKDDKPAEESLEAEDDPFGLQDDEKAGKGGKAGQKRPST